MSRAQPPAEIFDNLAPAETAWRNAAKRVLWRSLPRSLYQRLLARSKARDFATGRFREPELDLVERLVTAGDVTVDVGANHGMWTIALSEAVGVKGRVYSFEPVPFTFGTLHAVVRQRDLANVTLVNRGCSDRVATMQMAVPRQNSGSSDDLQAHLASRGQVGDGEVCDVDEVSCEMTTLDATLGGTEGVSLIKLDIEGAELLALRGAEGLISREQPALVCEVDAAFLAGFGQKPLDVVDFLSTWGYEPLIYDGARSCLTHVPRPEQIRHANVTFLLESHRSRLESLIQ